MVLDPHAVETLHDTMRRASARTATVSAQLREEGAISGAVKCWRRSLFRFFRFRDVRTVDRDVWRRMRRWGVTQRHLEIPIGEHRAHASPEAAWLKAKANVEKWRFLGRPAERYALPLVRELMERDAGDRDRLAGALLGALTTEPRLSRSKDLRYERQLRTRALRVLDPSRVGPTGLDPGRLERVTESFAAAYCGGDRVALANEIAGLFATDSATGAALLDLTAS
jgi:hypothetical protein